MHKSLRKINSVHILTQMFYIQYRDEKNMKATLQSITAVPGDSARRHRTFTVTLNRL